MSFACSSPAGGMLFGVSGLLLLLLLHCREGPAVDMSGSEMESGGHTGCVCPGTARRCNRQEITQEGPGAGGADAKQGRGSRPLLECFLTCLAITYNLHQGPEGWLKALICCFRKLLLAFKKIPEQNCYSRRCVLNS